MKSFKMLLVLAVFLSIGCEDTVRCVFGTTTELRDKELSVASYEEDYFELISAKIPFDHCISDVFILDLPRGLDYYIYDCDTIEISGYPTDIGNFTIEVIIEIEEIEYDTFEDVGLCIDYETSKLYRLVVSRF
ncbi:MULTISPECIES: hypothetical protein [Aquimarina]|uniref:hypothetical protein n=1 Tax=Aquimarina TaxID=290174 RepID=UPI001357B7AB|nr:MULTISPECIES: hypothetical protein [Aquimarina]